MIYKNFRINVIIRILLILTAGFMAIYVATQTYFWLVSLWIILLALILIFELIRYIERSHKDLSNFLLSIRQSDFSTVYPVSGERSQDELKRAYQEILKVFQQLRSEKEFNYQYLQTIVEHVNVALICFDDREEIQLINEAGHSLFGKPYLKNIQSLSYIHPELPEMIRHLLPGKKDLIKVQLNGSLMNLSVQASAFRLQQKYYKLVSFHDIRSELEAQEVESWQKLIRVLTHEIMNSVIPIATLTSVINGLLTESQVQPNTFAQLSEEDASDIRNSLQTIESRSKGLVSFVKAYSSLTQTLTPTFREVQVEELFSRIYTLLKPGIDKKGIRLERIFTDPDLHLQTDLDLLEQVLINLVMNAVDAVQGRENPVIELIAGKTSKNQIIIQVTDNGAGISEEVQQHIFIPFFTTKKQGSGIGLSLCKQIMLLHKGNISVQSQKDKGSTFSLYF
ncbi:GHKL domain-containing protein [Rhodocytophaga rosea]|uniref:histidine kinase n=1 Tax=Rhodocytophaga rosea TaxID=2704465 RepID=A0A6C0GIA2_9BACT|nr:ATP-binding protein [Rhodocytophaga rosea]QHT67554.1 GHKL domain-containing protein [Rhodocytophaga rosea]